MKGDPYLELLKFNEWKKKELKREVLKPCLNKT